MQQQRLPWQQQQQETPVKQYLQDLKEKVKKGKEVEITSMKRWKSAGNSPSMLKPPDQSLNCSEKQKFKT
jgi:hypothetical protein